MSVLPGTVLERGRVVPGAPLTLPGGETSSAWDHRGRAALVICFLHEGCEECTGYLASLEALSEDLRITGTRLLAAAPAPKFLGENDPPLILVVDRDGAAWGSYPSGDHAFPPPSEISATMWHLATSCRECEVGF